MNLIVFSYEEASRAITIKERAIKVDSNFSKIKESLKNANEYLSEYESKKAKLNNEKKDFFINLEEDKAITLIEKFFNMNNLNLINIGLVKEENISSTFNCWLINTEFSGTFEEIINLLSSLRNYEKNIIISEVDLRKLEKGLIKGNMNLCVYNIEEKNALTIIPQVMYFPIEINNNPFNRIEKEEKTIDKSQSLPYFKYGPNLLTKGSTVESTLTFNEDFVKIDYKFYGNGATKLILFFNKDIPITKETKILRCEIVGIEDENILAEMIIKDNERTIHKIMPTRNEGDYLFDLNGIETTSVIQRLEFSIKTKKNGSIYIKSIYMSEEI
ncbi:hypothetical protein [Anaeromicrobium sediminis]|uniref:hypothetical protein n=1 Tax=Anaeromicrobium sediminis TaxID=1478221 RepID=UPI0011405CA9|nr:hypothetical protein [Anaeromicrobium sediminis]